MAANKKSRAKPEPGSMEELADTLYMPSRIIEVTVREAEGDKVRAVKASIKVEPLDLVQISAVIRALKPIGAEAVKSTNVIQLLVEHPRELCNAVAAAINWDAARVVRIVPADFMVLYFAVMELNLDFLTRLPELLVSVLPAMGAAAAANGAGGTLSDFSADMAKEAQKSSH